MLSIYTIFGTISYFPTMFLDQCVKFYLYHTILYHSKRKISNLLVLHLSVVIVNSNLLYKNRAKKPRHRPRCLHPVAPSSSSSSLSPGALSPLPSSLLSLRRCHCHHRHSPSNPSRILFFILFWWLAHRISYPDIHMCRQNIRIYQDISRIYSIKLLQNMYVNIVNWSVNYR